MITTACPICNEELEIHNKTKIDKCVWRFVREAKNPVVYASRTKLICPTCGEEMLDHNIRAATKCVEQYLRDLEELDII